MLFAKVDVCVAAHPKFCAAGPAAVGYWAAALAYSCGQELDGHVPEHAIGAILGVGRKRGRALCERLVTVGLFERTEKGYVVAKFALKNVTKKELDARRQETAGRVASHRKYRAKEPREPACNAPSNAGGNALQGPALSPLQGGGVLNSLSLSLKSQSEDLNSLSPARAGEPEPSPHRKTIAPDLRLTPEARAAAEMLGVQDIEGEWVKFVAQHRANGTLATDFYALWNKWAVMARNYERKDRDREARRATTTGRAEPPPAPYHATGSRRAEVDLVAQLKARLAQEKPEGETQ
jgi:hypothetical protein